MSVVSGILNSQSTRAAADTTADAQTNAARMQQEEWNTQWNSHYNQTMQSQGTSAVNQLGSNIASGKYDKQFTMDDFQNSVPYQSMLASLGLQNQGITAQAAASGNFGSGRMANALLNNAQINAMSAEPQAYSQWQASNTLGLNALQSMAGLGQSQNLGMAGIGQNAVNGIGNSLTNAAQYQAAGTMGQTNALTGGLSSGTNALLQGLRAYNLYNNAGLNNNSGGYNSTASEYNDNYNTNFTGNTSGNYINYLADE